jgi:hypothetical protein
LLGVLIAFTTSNAVAAMTVLPQPVTLPLLWAASWLAVRFDPLRAVEIAGAGLGGWTIEAALAYWGLFRKGRTTEILPVSSESLTETET